MQINSLVKYLSGEDLATSKLVFHQAAINPTKIDPPDLFCLSPTKTSQNTWILILAGLAATQAAPINIVAIT